MSFSGALDSFAQMALCQAYKHLLREKLQFETSVGTDTDETDFKNANENAFANLTFILGRIKRNVVTGAAVSNVCNL